MMKKLITAITIMALLLCIIPACTENNNSTLAYLADYTIVFPSEYEAWQMEDVNFLADAIEKVAGKRPAVASDSEDVKTKEIIISGAKRNYTLPELTDEMSFAIVVEENRIILGGNGFYAGMRAIYAFVNDYLGYDDLTDTIAESPAKEIKGTEVTKYEEPAATTMTYVRGRYPFAKQADVKDLAEAGFNMVRLDASEIDQEFLRRYGKWCARFGVRMIYDALVNIHDNSVSTPDFDWTTKNPMMYGHYLVMFSVDYTVRSSIPDYHRYMSLIPAINYQENYGKYGWKLVVEIPDLVENDWFEKVEDVRDMIEENKTTGFKGVSVISISIELPFLEDERELDVPYAGAFDRARDLMESCGAEELWITAYQSNRPIDEVYDSHPSVFIRNASWALAMGAKGIVYSNYKRGIVVNADYTHGEHWDDVKRANGEFVQTYEQISAFTYLGTSVINRYEYPIAQLESAYTFENEELFEYNNLLNETGVFITYFKNDENNTIAIYAFCIQTVSKKTYEEIIPMPLLFNSKNNYKTYVSGTEQVLNDFIGGAPGQKMLNVKPCQGVLIIIEQ